MAIKKLGEYEDSLYGCRFCPMCKPAAEVANLTLIESYTTRARAMMLWRAINDFTKFTKRDVEILYQSTLDSISQAWCVNHYPVSDYIVAARAEVFKANLAPVAVKEVLKREMTLPYSIKSDVVFLAGEAAEFGDEAIIKPALGILEKIGLHAETVTIICGALAYSLGAIEQATKQAKQVIDMIGRNKVKHVIVDGPQTLWALRYIYPKLDIAIPEDVRITSLTEEILLAVQKGIIKISGKSEKKVFFHDSRSACLLSDKMASDEAIQPGFKGPEEILGAGDVYEKPRELIDIMGMERIFSVWSRSLSKSCGADDGLWLTYPEIAGGLARQRLKEFNSLNVDIIVTDSPLCQKHLSGARDEDDVMILWLPELLLGE